MILISHRRNTIEQLNSTPTEYGIEVDIRSKNGDLIIHHDPFAQGEFFENWLSHYRHKTLILNIKEEGLEQKLIKLMKKYQIEDYFFLDQSFPFLIKCSALGEHRCAVRVSEFESIETALKLAGKINWVWVDCFNHFALSKEDAQRLNFAGFKLCLVSPELQGRSDESEIPELARLLKTRNIHPDALCTKIPKLWKNYIECL
jgi:hypothetical protein